MTPLLTSTRARRGRLSLGLALFAAAAFRAVWLARPPTPATARAPAPRFVQVPSDKSPVTAKEVWARFPREKHEEFMRRAIANSRKAGVEFKTGGAFGAVIVDRNGNVLSDGLNHVIAQNDPTWHAEMH